MLPWEVCKDGTRFMFFLFSALRGLGKPGPHTMSGLSGEEEEKHGEPAIVGGWSSLMAEVGAR